MDTIVTLMPLLAGGLSLTLFRILSKVYTTNLPRLAIIVTFAGSTTATLITTAIYWVSDDVTYQSPYMWAIIVLSWLLYAAVSLVIVIVSHATFPENK